MMNFGQAIELAKQGKKVQRKGWNGKGMYVFMVHGELLKSVLDDNYNHILADNVTDTLQVANTLTLKSTTSIQVGWLASQTDMLGEDWVEV